MLDAAGIDASLMLEIAARQKHRRLTSGWRKFISADTDWRKRVFFGAIFFKDLTKTYIFVKWLVNNYKLVGFYRSM